MAKTCLSRRSWILQVSTIYVVGQGYYRKEKLLSRGYIEQGYLLDKCRRSYENVSGARRDDLKIGAPVIVLIEELRSIRTIGEIVKNCKRSYGDHSKMIRVNGIYFIIHHFSQNSTHPIKAMISFCSQRTQRRRSRPLCGSQ